MFGSDIHPSMAHPAMYGHQVIFHLRLERVDGTKEYIYSDNRVKYIIKGTGNDNLYLKPFNLSALKSAKNKPRPYISIYQLWLASSRFTHPPDASRFHHTVSSIALILDPEIQRLSNDEILHLKPRLENTCQLLT